MATQVDEEVIADAADLVSEYVIFLTLSNGAPDWKTIIGDTAKFLNQHKIRLENLASFLPVFREAFKSMLSDGKPIPARVLCEIDDTLDEVDDLFLEIARVFYEISSRPNPAQFIGKKTPKEAADIIVGEIVLLLEKNPKRCKITAHH